MNRLDEVMKDLESRGYGEHTERYRDWERDCNDIL